MPSLQEILISLAVGLIVAAAVLIARRLYKLNFEAGKVRAFALADEKINQIAQGDIAAHRQLGRDNSAMWQILVDKYANTAGWAELVDRRNRAILDFQINSEKSAYDETVAAYRTWSDLAGSTPVYAQLEAFDAFLKLRQKLRYSFEKLNAQLCDSVELKQIADKLLTQAIVELRVDAEAGSRDAYNRVVGLLKIIKFGSYHGVIVTVTAPSNWNRVVAMYELEIQLTLSERRELQQSSALLAAREALKHGSAADIKRYIWLIKAVLAWCYSDGKAQAQVGQANMDALADLVLYHARLTGISVPS